MTRRTRTATLLSAWMALGVVASPLGTLVHTATAEHHWCETHHHMVHGVDGPAAEAVARAGEGLSARPAEAAAEEWACHLAPVSRRDGLAAAPVGLPGAVCGDVADASLPPEAAPTRAPLTLAPKQGPPHA